MGVNVKVASGETKDGLFVLNQAKPYRKTEGEVAAGSNEPVCCMYLMFIMTRV